MSRGPPPDITEMYSLKVDNLSYRTAADELRPMFEKYGEVGDIYIPLDRDRRESRGFAFVRYYAEKDAQKAMDRLDGNVVDSREIRIQFARYGRPESNYNARSRSGGNHGRGRSPQRFSRRSRSRSRDRDSRRRRRSPSRSPDRRRPSRSHRRSRSRSRDRHHRRRSPSPKSPRREERDSDRSGSRGGGGGRWRDNHHSDSGSDRED